MAIDSENDAEALNTAIDIIYKYQKIVTIIEDFDKCTINHEHTFEYHVCRRIKEVISNGKKDFVL